MINIVYGPAVSGKSTYIYNLIKEDIKKGNKALLIVPDQFILSAESALSDLSDVIDIGGFDTEVLSFRRLPNHVFRKLGGLSFSDIDDGGRLLVMWRVLREVSPFLKAYSNIDEKNIAFTELMLHTVDEMKQYAITPTILDKASLLLKERHNELSDKLYDISFIYGAYQSFLSKEYNDPTDELTRLARTLESSDFFNGYKVYFDSFDSFTPQQYSVIRPIIAQAKEVTFSLCYDPNDNTGIFKTTEKTYKTILKLSDNVSEVLVNNNSCGREESIKYVSDNLWNHNARPTDFTGDISAVKTMCCHDKFEEAEAVVGDILKKISQGIRYKDILVIARDIEAYEGIIDSEFENNGIPFFMSKRTDITTKPIFKLILAALSIKNRNWTYSDVISYLKTGFAGVTYQECDVLENYASAWNINGRRWHDGIEWNMNPDGFVERITEEGQNILAEANAIRNRIVPPLEKLFDSIGKTTVRDVTVALYDFLCEIKVKEQIELRAAECRENNLFNEEKELVQLWNILINALDTLVDLLGDTKIDAEGYALLLRLLLSKTDIGTIPACIDQVILGSASNLRSSGASQVYLIGVNEGEFPKNCEENCVFSDLEKNILKTVDIELSPATDEAVSNELFWFYKAISAAKKSLTLSYTNSDLSGAKNMLSVAGSRINYLLGDKPIINYSDLPFVDKIWGRNTALKYVLKVRSTELGIALGNSLSKDEDLASVVHSYDSPLDAANDILEKELADSIYKGNVVADQSRFDSFVKCPFNYHCTYLLNLREKKTGVFRNNDIGIFVHNLLELFVQKLMKNGKFEPNISDDEIVELVDELSADYIERVCQGLPQSSPRIMQLFKRLKRTALLLCRNLVEEFKKSDFIPKFFEMPIAFKVGNGGVEPYAVTLDDGSKLYMKGKVDRVDIYRRENSDEVYVRVIDYKNYDKSFSLKNVEKGLDIQMLLYLFAIWNTQNAEFKNAIGCKDKIIPAGLVYHQTLSPTVKISNEDEIDSAYDSAGKLIKRSGLFLNDYDVLRAMDRDFSGVFVPVKINNDNSIKKNQNLKTLQEFGELSDKIDVILNNIAMTLKSGRVNAKPLVEEKPCEYCKMKPICRSSSKEVSDDE